MARKDIINWGRQCWGEGETGNGSGLKGFVIQLKKGRDDNRSGRRETEREKRESLDLHRSRRPMAGRGMRALA